LTEKLLDVSLREEVIRLARTFTFDGARKYKSGCGAGQEGEGIDAVQ
jgi:hypothetical protein